MKFLYCSSITYPSPYANRIQILAMAKALSKQLGDEFVLGGRNIDTDYVSKNISVENFPGSIRSFFLSWRYLRYIKKHSESCVVYGREEKLLWFLMLYNKWFFRLPIRVVYEAHEIPKMPKFLYRSLIRRVYKVIALTNPLKRDIIIFTKKNTKDILVSPDGVDFDQFHIGINQAEARKKLNLPQEKKIVLYTGSFFRLPWKGVDILLEASRCGFGKDVLFLLVGATKTEKEKVDQEFLKEKNVQVIEQVSHSQIPLFLRTADVLVLPNTDSVAHSREYTSPMKLFEYMASQVPIVASDLPSLRDILNTDNALLVPPKNSRVLAQSIQDLLLDSNMQKNIAKQAFQDVQRYTWKERVKHILEFINF